MLQEVKKENIIKALSIPKLTLRQASEFHGYNNIQCSTEISLESPLYDCFTISASFQRLTSYCYE